LAGDHAAALTGGGYAWLTVGGTPTTAGKQIDMVFADAEIKN
jgi:hypothetical protein